MARWGSSATATTVPATSITPSVLVPTLAVDTRRHVSLIDSVIILVMPKGLACGVHVPITSGTRPVLRSACSVSGLLGYHERISSILTGHIPIDETEILSGFLPRVSQCGDGSWCCANDATCCSNGRGIFLDSDGNSATAEGTKTVSYPPVSGTGLERYVSDFPSLLYSAKAFYSPVPLLWTPLHSDAALETLQS